MILSPKKMAIPLGLIILIGLMLGLWQRRDDYFLNKCVRLVTTRMIQFERLSQIRKEDYLFEFNHDHYLILNFNPKKQAWEAFARHSYPGGLVASPQDFEIRFTQGGISSIKHKDKDIELRQYMVLNFFHPKNQDKKRGIVFYKDKSWRPLT
jgi:hypothetical protein